jgi:hypothetical protein
MGGARVTPDQLAAIARADAQMRPGLEMVEERFWLWRLSCGLALPELKRLNETLRKLSAADLKRVAAFAEGLAEWSSDEAQSSDATK